MYEKIFQVQDTGMSQYWPILEHFGVPVYCPILVYLHGLEQASIILKLTILEQEYGPVWSRILDILILQDKIFAHLRPVILSADQSADCKVGLVQVSRLSLNL